LVSYPTNNYALFGLADCYKILKNYPKAIEIWEEYLRFDNRNITVLTRVADAYRKTGNFMKSRDTYFKTLEMNPENEYAFIGLGHLFYDFKEFDQALFYWKKVYEKYQDHVDVRVLTSIGNCYRKLKQYEEGIVFFKKALQLSPNNFYALFGLGDCYRGLNRMEDSRDCWQSILRKDPKNKVVLTRLGDTYRAMGDLEHAEEFYKKAMAIEFDTYAALGLAIVHKEQGHYDKAIEALNKLLEVNIKNSRVYLELSDCYERQGKPAKAIRILYQFLEMGMNNLVIMDKYEELKRAHQQTGI
jgi:tetratricopeptide (TPR) repeat protein